MRESIMDQDRLSGTAKNLGGKVEEGIGRATGDARTQLRGQMKQAEGSAQDLYGQAQEAAGETAEAVRKLSGSVEDALRDYIEHKPYTTALIALGLGWLIGRAHRPF
jgi:uncharacterized protein YjbJ (UPF0337 family)